MSVRKRGDIWHVRLQVGGQRIERSLGSSATKADALDYEAKIRKDIVAGKVGRPPARSLEDALARWLTDDAANLKSTKTILSQVRAIRDECAGKKLSAIVEVAESVKKSGLADGLKPATINRRVAILRRIANLAHDVWGWIDVPLGKKTSSINKNKELRRYTLVFKSLVSTYFTIRAADYIDVFAPLTALN